MSFNVRSGYDYSYEVIIPSPEARIQRNKVKLQTCFMMQQRMDGEAEGNKKLGEEDMSVTLPKYFEQVDDPNSLFSLFTYRLKEYSMPSDQIQSLIHDALDFAKQIVPVGSNSVSVSPIVINVKVCTVQLDGETILDATERSISPDCLAPMHLVKTIEKKDKSWRRSRLHKFLLFGLPRVRGDELLMETCSICFDGPTAVVPVTVLPCRHVFHRHCAVRWLLNHDSCPLCRQDKIILHKEGGAKTRDNMRIRSTTRTRSTSYLPRHPRRVRRPTRVPSWHRDYVVRSTIRPPSPTRARQTPTWHHDYVMGSGVSVRG